MEQGPFQHEKMGVGEAQELVHASRRLQEPRRHCRLFAWETMASGEHVVGQWYSWTTMKRWCHCMACMAQWRQNFEVQRTIKRAELTAFLCFLRKVSGPIKIHVENKGIIDGLRRGEKECIKPRAGDADLWIKIWEELRELVVKKRHLSGSDTCEGTPYEEKEKKR